MQQNVLLSQPCQHLCQLLMHDIRLRALDLEALHARGPCKTPRLDACPYVAMSQLLLELECPRALLLPAATRLSSSRYLSAARI